MLNRFWYISSWSESTYDQVWVRKYITSLYTIYNTSSYRSSVQLQAKSDFDPYKSTKLLKIKNNIWFHWCAINCDTKPHSFLESIFGYVSRPLLYSVFCYPVVLALAGRSRDVGSEKTKAQHPRNLRLSHFSFWLDFPRGNVSPVEQWIIHTIWEPSSSSLSSSSPSLKFSVIVIRGWISEQLALPDPRPVDIFVCSCTYSLFAFPAHCA